MAEKEKMPEMVAVEAEELPKSIVRRVVKEKLSQLSTDSEISVLRDSLVAFSESARIFIHYLSDAAHDVCKESKRQIINAEDVFKALEEIEFPEFIEPLRAALEEFRQRNSAKKAAASGSSSKPKDTNKKAKRKDPPAKTEGRNKQPQKIHKVESNAKRRMQIEVKCRYLFQCYL